MAESMQMRLDSRMQSVLIFPNTRGSIVKCNVT
jgi:hypothetical protein